MTEILGAGIDIIKDFGVPVFYEDSTEYEAFVKEFTSIGFKITNSWYHVAQYDPNDPINNGGVNILSTQPHCEYSYINWYNAADSFLENCLQVGGRVIMITPEPNCLPIYSQFPEHIYEVILSQGDFKISRPENVLMKLHGENTMLLNTIPEIRTSFSRYIKEEYQTLSKPIIGFYINSCGRIKPITLSKIKSILISTDSDLYGEYLLPGLLTKYQIKNFIAFPGPTKRNFRKNFEKKVNNLPLE